MNRAKRSLKEIQNLCGEICEDDGVHPRDLFNTSSYRTKRNYKAYQLAKQVAETISLLFDGGFEDPLLSNLRVVSVVPAPDTSRLLVTLYADMPIADFDQTDLEERLGRIVGHVRCEVAAAITRRKTPQLSYRIVGPDARGGEA